MQQLESGPKSLNKRGINISCDGTPDWEKEFSISKSNEKYTAEFKLCVVAGIGSREIVTHQIFKCD